MKTFITQAIALAFLLGITAFGGYFGIIAATDYALCHDGHDYCVEQINGMRALHESLAKQRLVGVLYKSKTRPVVLTMTAAQQRQALVERWGELK